MMADSSSSTCTTPSAISLDRRGRAVSVQTALHYLDASVKPSRRRPAEKEPPGRTGGSEMCRGT